MIDSVLPCAAARCSGVAPPARRGGLRVRAGLQQRLDGRRASRARGEVQRRVVAVARRSPRVARRRRPASRSASASPRVAAQCRAVMPSPCAAFTSAPCLSSARTRAVSPRMAASATGESAGAGVHAPRTSARPNADDAEHRPLTLASDRAVRHVEFRARASVLSPNCFMSSMPSMCIMLSMAFAIGVPSGALMCRLPASLPLACPTRKSGQRRGCAGSSRPSASRR